jgi:RNA polymerase sigma factor (sigma-70 family)
MAEDKKAWVERLMSAHGGALRRLFYQRTRSAPDAEDLVQEVYMRMLQIPDMDSIRDPERYLFTVAVNLAREHRKRAHSTVDVNDPSVEAELAEFPSFGGQIDAAGRIKRLREVLPELSAKCQAAVVLQYWHNLSYEEIAQRLGVSTHMVKKYLSQALVHCRRRMARWR